MARRPRSADEARQARRGAHRATILLSLAVFSAVMMGTLGILVYAMSTIEGGGTGFPAVAPLVAGVGLVLVFGVSTAGWLLTRNRTEAALDAAEAVAPVSADGSDVVLEAHRRARPIVVVLGGLALLVPVAGIAATPLPTGLRWAVFGGLVVVAVGFARYAIRRLS